MKSLNISLAALWLVLSEGNGQGTMGGSQIGNLVVNSYSGGTGGGGMLAMNSKGTDNFGVGNF